MTTLSKVRSLVVTATSENQPEAFSTMVQSNSVGKNLIINGVMQVAQRGTSGTGESYKSVDRFFFTAAALDNHALTQTQQAVTDLAGFPNSFRITTTTAESAIAADELAYVAQKIEAQNLQHLAYGTSSAKTLTLSFYVKSSVTGTFSTNLYQADDARVVNSEYTISSANTWERKEITYAADQTGVIDNNNGIGFYVTWNLALGSSWKGNAATAWEAYNTDNWAGAGTYTDAVITTVNSTWEITGVQLEVGDVATSFEHESFGETLLKCQRYFYRVGGEIDARGNYTGAITSGVLYGPTAATTMRPNPVTMRDAPNVTFDDTLANYTVMTSRTTNAVTVVGDNSSTASTVRINVSCGATSNDGDGAILRSTRTQSTVSIDAEL